MTYLYSYTYLVKFLFMSVRVTAFLPILSYCWTKNSRCLCTIYLVLFSTIYFLKILHHFLWAVLNLVLFTVYTRLSNRPSVFKTSLSDDTRCLSPLAICLVSPQRSVSYTKEFDNFNRIFCRFTCKPSLPIIPSFSRIMFLKYVELPQLRCSDWYCH